MKISETLQKSSPLIPKREMSKTEYMKLVDANTELVDKMNDIQKRIDKAIEYLKDVGCYDDQIKTFCDDVYEELPYLLAILEGRDK